jgi:transposase
LERRRIIDILPDREAATVTAWLAERPTIEVIARDRGAGYMQAATQGRPEAVQVADRWHLMEN